MQDELSDQGSDQDRASFRFGLLRVPLFRLLAINLAAGAALAAVLVGGLLALNPGGLRHLIFADSSPGTALGLLLFGFVVTFGSTAMGTAIMAMGRAADDEKRRGPPAPVARPARAERPGTFGTRRLSTDAIDPRQYSSALAFLRSKQKGEPR